MRAVLLEGTEGDLARRRRLGLDRRDEMWEGVLHMTPAPACEHQRILDELIVFLAPLLKREKRGILRSGINIFDEAARGEDYRIPDLTFVETGREAIIATDGIRGGGPDAVVEIRSPEDETYEKLPFFAALAVREVIVISRDTKAPEAYRLAASQYLTVGPDPEGWIPSEVLGVRFRLVSDTPPRVAVEDLGDSSVRTEI